MSHYTRSKSKINRRSAIVTALKAMGFKDHMIEVSDTKMNLRGYQGDTRAQKANIRIKGAGWPGENYVGGASNDLGLELEADGTYSFHISEYDSMQYNKQWRQKFIQEYGKAVIEEVCDEQNMFISETHVENGQFVVTAETQF